MPEPPPEPGRTLEDAGPVEPGAAESLAELGYVPPDPDEPPPVELWRAVSDVTPWGTTLLLFSWSVVFTLLAARGELGRNAALLARGANLTQLDPWDVPWRLLASTFLHASPGHVFFNALSMLVFGPAVERIFSRWGFWIVYGIGGALASLTSVGWGLARYGPGQHLSLGASGAIFALGGALIAASFRLRAWLAPGRARALFAAIAFLALPAFANGFHRLGTDNAAHAGGLLAGLLLGSIVPLSPRLGGRSAGLLVRVLASTSALALAASLAKVFAG